MDRRRQLPDLIWRLVVQEEARRAIEHLRELQKRYATGEGRDALDLAIETMAQTYGVRDEEDS